MFSRAGKLICLMFRKNATAPLLERLSRFFGQFETYFHPSNTGGWSTDLSLFVVSFINVYIKRLRECMFLGRLDSRVLANKPVKEGRKQTIPKRDLTKEDDENVVDLFLPLLHHSVYSKSTHVSVTAAYCIGFLSCMPVYCVF